MVEAVNCDEAPTANNPLWVVLTSARRTVTFELDGLSHRAIVIGSSRNSEFCYVESSLAPVECFLERDGDEIWLVPGCPSGELRVDSVIAVRPIRLWRRCVIEVATMAFNVRIREEPPTSPDHEIPTEWTLPLPVTSAKGEAISGEPGRDATTESTPTPLVQRDLRAPQSDGRSADSGESAGRISVRRIIALESPVVGLPESVHATGTRTDVGETLPRRSRPSWNDEEVPVSAPTSRMLEFCDPPPSSTSASVASTRTVGSGPTQRLEQLGVLALNRPWVVALGVVLGAVSIASLLHFGTAAVTTLRPTSREQWPRIQPYLMLDPLCREQTMRSSSLGQSSDVSRRALCGWLPEIRRPLSVDVFPVFLGDSIAQPAASGSPGGAR